MAFPLPRRRIGAARLAQRRPPPNAFVIVMEMTDRHGMIIPLMVAAMIRHAVSRLVCPAPLYRALAAGFLPKRAPPQAAHAQARR